VTYAKTKAVNSGSAESPIYAGSGEMWIPSQVGIFFKNRSPEGRKRFYLGAKFLQMFLRCRLGEETDYDPGDGTENYHD
jgi:hypothetical protein